MDTAFGNEGERKENQKNKPYYIRIHICERNDHNMLFTETCTMFNNIIVFYFTFTFLYFIFIIATFYLNTPVKSKKSLVGRMSHYKHFLSVNRISQAILGENIKTFQILFNLYEIFYLLHINLVFCCGFNVFWQVLIQVHVILVYFSPVLLYKQTIQ